MIRWFFRRKLDRQEQRLNVSMDYLRHILDVSPAAFLRFMTVLSFSGRRKTLPKTVWFAAQLAALREEHCSPCLQIGVNMAQRSRVDPHVLDCLVRGRFDDLPEELADVASFARSVATGQDDDESRRERLRERYGEQGLIDLSFAIAGVRVFPAVKRALGFVHECPVVAAGLSDQPSPSKVPAE